MEKKKEQDIVKTLRSSLKHIEEGYSKNIKQTLRGTGSKPKPQPRPKPRPLSR